MDIEGFIQEIKTDPLGRGYAQMSDDDLWESLQQTNRTRLCVVNSRQLLEWIAAESRYMKLENAAANVSLGDAVRSVVKAAIKLVDRPDTLLDLTQQSQLGMLNALQLSGVFSGDDYQSLLNLATENISRATEINCDDMDKRLMIYLRSINN